MSDEKDDDFCYDCQVEDNLSPNKKVKFDEQYELGRAMVHDLTDDIEQEAQDMEKYAPNQLDPTNDKYFDIQEDLPEFDEYHSNEMTLPEIYTIVNDEGNKYLKGKRDRYMSLIVDVDTITCTIFCYDFKTDKFYLTKMERALAVESLA
jgi:hypothetical protein